MQASLNIKNKKLEMDKTQQHKDKSPLGQFQSTPNSNHTTSQVVIGSRDRASKNGRDDSLGQSLTYRSENVKNSDNVRPDQQAKNKVHKKLNNLLTEAQAI